MPAGNPASYDLLQHGHLARVRPAADGKADTCWAELALKGLWLQQDEMAVDSEVAPWLASAEQLVSAPPVAAHHLAAAS